MFVIQSRLFGDADIGLPLIVNNAVRHATVSQLVGNFKALLGVL